MNGHFPALSYHCPACGTVSSTIMAATSTDRHINGDGESWWIGVVCPCGRDETLQSCQDMYALTSTTLLLRSRAVRAEFDAIVQASGGDLDG